MGKSEAQKRLTNGFPAVLLRRSQLSVEPDNAPKVEGKKGEKEKDAWKKEHDFAIEIAVTVETVMQLKQYDGSLVQVRNAGDSQSTLHLARLIKVPQGQRGFKDGVLYISPILAFNLGLNLHLESLVQADYSMASVSDTDRTQSGQFASTSKPNGVPSLPQRRKDPKVIVTSLPEPDKSFRENKIALLSQPGCVPARIGLADAVTFALVRVPNLQLLNSQTDMDEEEKEGKAKDPLQDKAEEEVKPPPFQGEGVPEEAIVETLQNYLREKPRLFAKGDIVVIPFLEGTHITGLLKTLYQGHPVPELLYFKVMQLEPSSSKSALVVSERAHVTLQANCQSGIPPCTQPYIQSSLWPGSTKKDSEHGQSKVSGKPKNGEGILMWQRIAAILAPVLHPARTGVTLRATVLISGPKGVGKETAITKAASELGVHLIPFPCQELRAGSDPKTAISLRMAFNEAKEFAPAILVLKDVESLIDKGPAGAQPGAENGPARIAAALSDCILSNKNMDEQVLVVGTSSSLPEVPAPIRRCFAHELKQEAPDLTERADLLQSLLPEKQGLSGEDLSSAALHTAGLLPSDLKSAVADSVISAMGRTYDVDTLISQASDDHAQSLGPSHENEANERDELGCQIQIEDLNKALESVQKRTATALGAPQVPNVKWEDVGGLEDVKGAILETVELPLKHPELFSSGLRRRSGLLLYGPPGTGKTLIAKAVATECSINFLSVKGPELINMYIGESERQVREVFERARRARPCVLFFDELDSLAPSRGAGADSGGVMDRVVSQLLAEVDNLAGGGGIVSGQGGSSQDVFLIGATNRPDLLDTALMRPGRLDKLLYVGVAQNPEDKLKVLHALTRKFTLAPSVILSQIAGSCPQTLTGADLYALCADAWMAGLRRLTSQNDYAEDAEEVNVEQKDFESALASLTPSLSFDELARYQTLRSKYQSL